MHIIEVAYEATAFDVHLTRGGTATVVWDLASRYAAAGHRVSVVTPAHGRVATELSLPVETRAYVMPREGVAIYFLSDAYLDLLPDTLHPANGIRGTISRSSNRSCSRWTRSGSSTTTSATSRP